MPKTSEQSKLALAFAAGSALTSNIAGGVLAGYLLDKWLKTQPWLSVTGLVLGTASAFFWVYKITLRLQEGDGE